MTVPERSRPLVGGKPPGLFVCTPLPILATVRGMPNKPARDRHVLWSRIRTPTDQALKWIADYTSLSGSVVVDAIICSKLGQDHPHAFVVSQAVQRWKKAADQ